MALKDGPPEKGRNKQLAPTYNKGSFVNTAQYVLVCSLFARFPSPVLYQHTQASTLVGTSPYFLSYHDKHY